MNLNKVHIIGWGSQAKAWALNLRDSGCEVTIGLRFKSGSTSFAQDKNFKTRVLGTDKIHENEHLHCLLIPDDQHLYFFKEFANEFPKNTTFIYAHGFSIEKEKIYKLYPQFNHLLLAPKAIASELRWQYESNGKLGAAYSLEYCNLSVEAVSDFATKLGITSGPYETTFRDEMIADLFSEQSLLCSFMPYAMQYSFDKLVEKGISPEIAYLECWYEVKLIADALIPIGPSKFFELISPNALLGGVKAKNILFDEAYQKKLDILLEDILSDQFFNEIDRTNFNETRKEVLKYWQNSELEKTHEKLKDSLFKK